MGNRAPVIPVGTIFTRWSVISAPVYKNQKTFYNCKCSCGKEQLINRQSLLDENSRSCGCLHKEIVSETATRTKTTHGMSKTPTYNSWSSMLMRCTNKNSEDYESYGGRGITVCEKWHKFEQFYADMGECPEGLSIGRKDNDGNYCPENCRWETSVQQGNNRRSSRIIIVGDKSMTVTEAARLYNINPITLFGRLDSGWDTKLALETPMMRPYYGKK